MSREWRVGVAGLGVVGGGLIKWLQERPAFAPGATATPACSISSLAKAIEPISR